MRTPEKNALLKSEVVFTFIYLYTIFDQRRLDIIDQVEHGRSSQQVTHLPPVCGIFYFPWHRHHIEGTNGF